MAELRPWQGAICEKLNLLQQESFEKHQSITHIIQGFRQYQGQDAVANLRFAMQIAYACGEQEADDKAKECLKPGETFYIGTRNTCILMWSFADASLWRGLSDNKKLVRLARSMISNGFLKDEPIRSRTFDLSDEGGVLAQQLHFGDGQARGLAARLAYQMMLTYFNENPQDMGCITAMKIMQTLMEIPTVFERCGTNSVEDLMVAQAVRQNVKATMTLPMNSVEWAGLILRSAGLHLNRQQAQQAKAIIQCLNSCTSKYNANLETEAYDGVEPAAKRARRSNRRSQGLEASGGSSKSSDRIKIGYRRLTAIKNLLSNCSEDVFKKIEMHLVWVGNYADSAISDDILNLPWLWPRSNLQCDEDPHAQGALRPEMVPKGATVVAMEYDGLLTNEEHELLFTKALTIFEDEVLHRPDHAEWKRFVPTAEMWQNYRIVIQHWTRTIRECCTKDMTKDLVVL